MSITTAIEGIQAIARIQAQRARLYAILDRHVRPEDAKCTDVGLVLAVYGRWLEQSSAHIGPSTRPLERVRASGDVESVFPPTPRAKPTIEMPQDCEPDAGLGMGSGKWL